MFTRGPGTQPWAPAEAAGVQLSFRRVGGFTRSVLFPVTSLTRGGEIQGSESLRHFAQRERTRNWQSLDLSLSFSGSSVLAFASPDRGP